MDPKEVRHRVSAILIGYLLTAGLYYIFSPITSLVLSPKLLWINVVLGVAGSISVVVSAKMKEDYLLDVIADGMTAHVVTGIGLGAFAGIQLYLIALLSSAGLSGGLVTYLAHSYSHTIGFKFALFGIALILTFICYYVVVAVYSMWNLWILALGLVYAGIAVIAGVRLQRLSPKEDSN